MNSGIRLYGLFAGAGRGPCGKRRPVVMTLLIGTLWLTILNRASITAADVAGQ